MFYLLHIKNAKLPHVLEILIVRLVSQYRGETLSDCLGAHLRQVIGHQEHILPAHFLGQVSVLMLPVQHPVVLNAIAP